MVARVRDVARHKERLDRGEDLPDYMKQHAVYYAGLVLLLAQACFVFVLFLFMRTPGEGPPPA